MIHPVPAPPHRRPFGSAGTGRTGAGATGIETGTTGNGAAVEPDGAAAEQPSRLAPGQAGRLWISWLLVAVLLGHGVKQPAITAARLFTV